MRPTAYMTNGFENSREKRKSMPLSVLHAPPNRLTRRDYSRPLLLPLPAASERCYMLRAMTAASRAVETPAGEAFVRGLGLLEGTTLIVGSVIGSGIFVAPSIMAGYVQSPAAPARLVGGGRAADRSSGRSPTASWRRRCPGRAGNTSSSSRIFSPLWGFLYGWTFLLAINTGFVAAVSVAFAKYLGVFLPGVSENVALFAVGRFRFTTAQAVALVVIAALTYLNIRGLRTGAWVQNVFTVAKVAGVAALVVLAIASGRGSAANLGGGDALALGPGGREARAFRRDGRGHEQGPVRLRRLELDHVRGRGGEGPGADPARAR